MTPLAQALNTALLHFIWQGIAIGLLLWIALFLLRRSSANARYAASCAALALLALAPVVTAWTAYRPQTEAPISGKTISSVAAPQGSGLSAEAPSEILSAPYGFEGWILPAWALGVALFALRLMWCWGHTSALRRTGTPAESFFLAMVSNVAERVGVAHSIRVLMSSVAEVPSVIGWARPVLLLPVAVAAGLTPEQLEAVIAHELAHIRRHDYLVNLMQTMAETVLFYHPAVWWASSRIRYERELCCDDLAVAALGDAAGYARALARLEQLRPLRPSLAMGAADGPLFHRIERLLGGDGQQHGPSRLMCAIGLLVGVVFLAFNMSLAQGRQDVPRTGNTVEDFFVQAPPMPPIPPIPSMPARPTMPAIPPIPPIPPMPPMQAEGLPALFAALQRVTQGIDNADRALAGLEMHWVLFRGDRVMSSGSSSDEAEARTARQTAGGGDLLWFRREGKAYISQDRQILDRVVDLNFRMEATGEAQQFLVAQQQKFVEMQNELQRRQAQLGITDSVQINLDRLRVSLDRIKAQLAAPATPEEKLSAAVRDTEALTRRLVEIQVDDLQQAEFRREQASIAAMQAALSAREAEASRVRAEGAQRLTLQILQLLRDAVSSGKARVAQ